MNHINEHAHKLLHTVLDPDLLLPIFIFLCAFFILALPLFSIYRYFIYPSKQSFKRKNEHGYIITANGNFEHREIVEKLIKRSLRYGEEVHHINGVKWDNRKSNLALMTKNEHQRWHQRLEWMWEQRMRPSIKWQRKKLKSEFGAILF